MQITQIKILKEKHNRFFRIIVLAKETAFLNSNSTFYFTKVLHKQKTIGIIYYNKMHRYIKS